LAEGDKERLEKLLEYLKLGPPAARVGRVTIKWQEFSGRYSEFKIKY
jgi:acylphosphatase